MIRCSERGGWPGLDLDGQTLAELRRRIRREREAGAVGTASTTPPATERPTRRPEIRDRDGEARQWN
jgi:hypothetical protein